MATVIVIGSGGREHVLAKVVSDSPAVTKVYCIPGNAGTATLPKAVNITVANGAVAIFAKNHNADLVVIGPEAPLMMGLADELRSQGTAVVGPGSDAARLETSKAYAAEFMAKYNIPTPPSWVVHDINAAINVVEKLGVDNCVLKCDGLANGKGVILPSTSQEAQETLVSMFNGVYDGNGQTVVVQQRYHGPEISAFAISDGDDVQLLPLLAQNQKRLLADNQGLSTGGMGAYAPLPEHIISLQQASKLRRIAEQTISGMKLEGVPYQGVLFIGAMLAQELNGELTVIEYNARFGDPDAQVVLSLLARNGVDIYELLYASATGSIAEVALPGYIKGSAVAICLAAAGYPQRSQRGAVVHGLQNVYKNVEIFHAATKKQDDGSIVNSGGRVVYVTGFGDTLQQASQHANAAIGTYGVNFEGMQYRNDIGLNEPS